MTDSATPMRLPSFLIVGAMKSATTSLADLIGSHPDCYMAPREIHFFNHEDRFKRGPGHYATFFAEAGGVAAVGEKTPSYTDHVRHPDIARRIRETLGPVRLIWILREPVARTVSHYRHGVMTKAIREKFDVVISRELDQGHFTAAPIVARSRYAEQVRLYLEHFPRNLMHFCLFEQFVAEPLDVAVRVAGFLGLDPDPAHFSGNSSRNRTGERAAAQREKAGPLGRFLLARRNRLLNSPSGPMLDRLADHFQQPNRELASITGLDLTAWSKRPGAS
jgi:hypothetical protein